MPAGVRVRLEEAAKFRRLLEAEEAADRALSASSASRSAAVPSSDALVVADEAKASGAPGQLTAERLAELKGIRRDFDEMQELAASPLKHIPVLTNYAQSAPVPDVPAQVSLKSLDLELEAMRLEEEIISKRRNLGVQQAENAAAKMRDERALQHLDDRIAEHRSADRTIDADALPDVRAKCRLIREQHRRERLDAEAERLRFRPKHGSPWCGDGTRVADPVSREALAVSRPSRGSEESAASASLKKLCTPDRTRVPGDRIRAIAVEDVAPQPPAPLDVSVASQDRAAMAKKNPAELEEILRMRTVALSTWVRKEADERLAITHHQEAFIAFAAGYHTMRRRELRSRNVLHVQWKLGIDSLRGAMAVAEDARVRRRVRLEVESDIREFAALEKQRASEMARTQAEAASLVAAQSRVLDEAYREGYRAKLGREEAARARLHDLETVITVHSKQLAVARQRLKDAQAQDIVDDVTRASTLAQEQHVEYQEIQLDDLLKERDQRVQAVRDAV